MMMKLLNLSLWFETIEQVDWVKNVNANVITHASTDENEPTKSQW